MSYSDDVAKFMHVLGPFYEAVYDGQEPENLRRLNPSPQPSDATEKDQMEDESGYSSSINGTGAEETGKGGDINSTLKLSAQGEEPHAPFSPYVSCVLCTAKGLSVV